MTQSRYLPWDRVAAAVSTALLALVAWIGSDVIDRLRNVELELVELRHEVRSRLASAGPADPLARNDEVGR